MYREHSWDTGLEEWVLVQIEQSRIEWKKWECKQNEKTVEKRETKLRISGKI